MLTLIFLVCSPITGECYSATSTTIYPTEEACQQDALVIMDRVAKQQEADNLPLERAIHKCISWGSPV